MKRCFDALTLRKVEAKSEKASSGVNVGQLMMLMRLLRLLRTRQTDEKRKGSGELSVRESGGLGHGADELLVTTSKALVTTSVAPVTTSVAPVTTSVAPVSSVCQR